MDARDCPPPPQEECFTAFLSDTYGDGWQGNVLTIENEGTGEVVHQLTQSGSITASVEAITGDVRHSSTVVTRPRRTDIQWESSS